MKRWLLKADVNDIGGLLLEEVPMPTPGRGEVRVRVHAVSLNQRDLLTLVVPDFRRPDRDIIPVSDGAGEIDAIGPGVEGWTVGERVVGIYFRNRPSGPPTPDMGTGLGSGDEDGMLAEYVVLPADRIARAPDNLTFEEAATLPCAGVTAWTALQGQFPVKSGQKVLVVGTGGVSLIATLLARSLGAEVFATTSRDAKRSALTALGISGVVNYRDTPDWGKAVFELTGGVDKVVNAGGLGSVNQSMAALKPGGEVVSMGLFTAGDALDPMQIMAKALSLRGTAVGSAEDLGDLVSFVDRAAVRPPIGGRFGMDQAKEAYEALRSADAFGKIVINAV